MAAKTTARQKLKQPGRRELLALERRVGDLPPSLEGELRFHLVYPNHYWVAMSNLGFQAVYRILATQDAVAVERGFLPEDPEGSPQDAWRSFETGRPLADCDIIGFSMSFETDYPHLVRMLNRCGLLSRDFAERERLADEARFNRPLIIAGGTAITLNPEPIAELIDVIVVGEAEEVLEAIVEEAKRAKREGVPRLELLRRLARIEGVYVPRFYTPSYRSDDTVAGWDVDPAAPERPMRHFVKDLSKYPAYTAILTPETEFKDMFLTETGRGCEMGCRFCVAGYIYRPVRKRSEESLAETVQIGLKKSEAIGFVGAAVSSHRAIGKLASQVAESGARASLSSLMSQKVTRQLAGSLSESEYKTVALAPEAGTERLRRAAGKRVRNDQVVTAARELAEAGIRGFKLYFIVGLPTETDEDIDAIAALATEIRNAVIEVSRSSTRAAWVTLSVNPFIPKAWTPFQWEPILDRKVLDRKIDRVRELIKRVPNLEMRFESPKESYFQALLSRGDRRVTQLLLAAEEQGEDWKWLLNQSKRAFIPGVPALDFYVARRIPFDEPLPWEVVDARIDRSLLKREALRAYHGEEFRLEEDGDVDEPFPAQLLDSPELIERAVLG